jgi:hypothetical protein
MAAMTSRNSSKSKISRRRIARPALALMLAVALLGALTACKPTTTPTVTQTPPPTTSMPMPTTTMGMPPPPMPMGGGTIVPDQCQLPQLAFCDTFQTINAGGRAGDLDESKWSAARTSQSNNPHQGQLDNYKPFEPEFCMDHNGPLRIADQDSFICGEQFGESNHWMEGMNDAGDYANNSFRILQPFDFANRTGNVVWDVDAKTLGGHSWWTEVWLTDEPVQAPHLDHPGTHIFPRNGVMLLFDADWCGNNDLGPPLKNALRQVTVFTNYHQTDYTVRSPCFTTQDDHANHFLASYSANNVTVKASDAGGANFRTIASVNLPTLPLTRGYFSFQHSQYNGDKFNGEATQTYHWHAIGFDGPTLPLDRDYQVPDALAGRSDGSVNLGYDTGSPKTFSLPNVNLAGATKAYLTYDVYWSSSNKAIVANINGIDRTGTDPNPDAPGASGYLWRNVVQPISLSDLRNGTNTISLKPTNCSDNCPTVANIDLELTTG